MTRISYFVTPKNCQHYTDKTKALVLDRRDRELKLAGCPANERVHILDTLSDKLEKLFNAAERHYNGTMLTRDISNLDFNFPYICYRVQIAYLVASRSNAALEDVALALLAPCAIPITRVPGMEKTTADRLEKEFGEAVSAPFRTLPEQVNTEQEITDLIFNACCERMLESIKQSIERHHSIINVSAVIDAYTLARRVLGGKLRRTGDPYLLRALYVADLLAANGLDSDVVAASLLRDTQSPEGDPEDDLSIEAIERHFNSKISTYVAAVATIDKARYARNAKVHAASPDEKEDYDEQSRAKLSNAIASNPDMVAALYIKAAECIHDLLTLDTVDSAEAGATIDEIEALYLKLFEEHRLNYFINVIKSECLRYHNPERHRRINEGYTTLLDSSRPLLDGYEYDDSGNPFRFVGFHGALEDYVESFNTFAGYAKLFESQAPFQVEYKAVPYTVSEVDWQLQSYMPSPTDSFKDMMMTKKNLFLEKFYIILTPTYGNQSIYNFVKSFLANYKNGLAEGGYTFFGMHHDSTYDQYHFHIFDRYYNKLDVIITMKKNYVTSLYGAFAGSESTEPVPLQSTEKKPKIRVFKADHTELELDVGSTALDFAYAVHHELCLEAYEAIINGVRRAIYTELHEGDHVYICKYPGELEGHHKKAPRGLFVPRVTVRWLKYTKSIEVQRFIINFIAQQFHGDDVFSEGVVGNDTYQAHMNNIFALNRVIMDLDEGRDAT